MTSADAAATYERLAALGGDVLVEEMVDGGAEMLVGVAPTPLGQVLTLASGGVLTEVLDDAVFRLLPVTEEDAREMVADLRGAAVLHGVRGRPALDVEAVVRLLVGVSDLVSDWPSGYELDLNPVAVLRGRGAGPRRRLRRTCGGPDRGRRAGRRPIGAAVRRPGGRRRDPAAR